MLDRNELTKLAAALGGLPVLACRAGSPAAVAGIRYGDIVLSVNGVETPDWSAFIAGRTKSNTEMRVELFRDGERLTFDLLLDAAPIDPPTLLAEILAERIVPLAPAIDLRPKKPN